MLLLCSLLDVIGERELSARSVSAEIMLRTWKPHVLLQVFIVAMLVSVQELKALSLLEWCVFVRTQKPL